MHWCQNGGPFESSTNERMACRRMLGATLRTQFWKSTENFPEVLLKASGNPASDHTKSTAGVFSKDAYNSIPQMVLKCCLLPSSRFHSRSQVITHVQTNTLNPKPTAMQSSAHLACRCRRPAKAREGPTVCRLLKMRAGVP